MKYNSKIKIWKITHDEYVLNEEAIELEEIVILIWKTRIVVTKNINTNSLKINI